MGRGVEIAGGSVETAPSPAEAASRRVRIRLIGEVSVQRGDARLELPRSRKCRALIAYLATTGRPHRREALCELLWEVPDDPKGELRWTLSKVRGVLGDALVADRERVALDQAAVEVDAAELLVAAENPLAVSTPMLERLAGRGDATLAPDLDLPRCPEFQAWLYAVREDVRRAQLVVLDALVRRLGGEPERALPYARARVAADPLDEGARLGLLELLVATGRTDEAEQQRRLAVDALREAGIPVPAQLGRTNARPPGSQPGPKLIQRIRYCKSADGTRIAWSAVGDGPPLVKSANWMSHLEHEWDSGFLGPWLVELSREHSLVRYDARGNGLSDRNPADLSLDAFVSDLEAVSDQLEEPSFDLIGISQGASVAIAFAARHPEKVRKLVLFGGFASGWRHARSAEVRERWEAMITLTRTGWGADDPAFRQLFTSQFLPRATSEQQGWFNELQRVSCSPEGSQRLQRAIGEFDARDHLAAIRAPTLVFHCRGDSMVPFDSGRYLASHIPDAEFVSLDSDNHMPLEDELAWTLFVERLREFLAR